MSSICARRRDDADNFHGTTGSRVQNKELFGDGQCLSGHRTAFALSKLLSRQRKCVASVTAHARRPRSPVALTLFATLFVITQWVWTAARTVANDARQDNAPIK